MVKIISDKDSFIDLLIGAGGKIVKEERGLIIVQGLKLGSDENGSILYNIGSTVHFKNYGLIAVEGKMEGKEVVYLY